MLSDRMLKTLNKIAFLVLTATIFSAAQALAQTDGGNSGFAVGNLVANTGLKMGAVNGAQDGIKILGGQILVDSELHFEVTTDGAGTLIVGIDHLDANAAFTASAGPYVVPGAGTHTFIVAAVPSLVAGDVWFRFAFAAQGALPDFTADHSGTHTGEIEDYLVTVVALAGTPALAVEPGGGTTSAVRSGADVIVTSAGKTIFKGPQASLGGLTINGDALNNSFVVDLAGGDPIPGGGLTVNGAGQAGVPGDVLTVTGGGLQALVTHTFVNDNDGSVAVTEGTVTYTGLEPITDNLSLTE